MRHKAQSEDHPSVKVDCTNQPILVLANIKDVHVRFSAFHFHRISLRKILQHIGWVFPLFSFSDLFPRQQTIFRPRVLFVPFSDGRRSNDPQRLQFVVTFKGSSKSFLGLSRFKISVGLPKPCRETRVVPPLTDRSIRRLEIQAKPLSAGSC